MDDNDDDNDHDADNKAADDGEDDIDHDADDNRDLRANDATATRTSLKKWFYVPSVLIVLFLPTYFVKCRRTLSKLNFEGP